MKGVTLHPHAFTELMEQAEYYDQERAGVGLEFLADIERTFERLLDEPELGAAIGSNLRAFPVGRFPHSVVYGPAADGIFVVAVAHQRRAPNYWRSRLGR